MTRIIWHNHARSYNLICLSPHCYQLKFVKIAAGRDNTMTEIFHDVDLKYHWYTVLVEHTPSKYNVSGKIKDGVIARVNCSSWPSKISGPVPV